MPNSTSLHEGQFPRIANLGVSGLLVQFGDTLSEPVNRAALALRAHLEKESWDGVEETSTSLSSVFVRFDPLHLSHASLRQRLEGLLRDQDWYAANLPTGRRHWHIPCSFGGSDGPQLGEAAALAGHSEPESIADIEAHPVQVLTIGFAPGQPYMGSLPVEWDIPRQTGLTAKVPEGALVVAIRQLIIFASDAPTGWRHIGQTAFRCYRPEAGDPFALRPGDLVSFYPISPDELSAIRFNNPSGDGGAKMELLS
ncbi:MAG: allophanate hydrolase subunit 1 [Paracoccaceae bacterium]